MGVPFRTAKKWITKRVIADYSNQLDLFSEAVPEPPTPVVPAPPRAPGASKARPRPQQLGFEIWEPLAPFEANHPVASDTPASVTAAADQDIERPEPQRPQLGDSDEASPGDGGGGKRPRSTQEVHTVNRHFFDLEIVGIP